MASFRESVANVVSAEISPPKICWHPAHAVPTMGLPPGQLRLMTIRSHDQFNTTIYGLNDRYRGIFNERRVIFMNEKDMLTLKLKKEDIGLIEVKDFFSFVAIKKIKVSETLQLIKNEKIKNKKVKIEVAR